MNLQPLSSANALDAYFLEARSKLLDIAAILDRIDRGGATLTDPRLNRIAQAVEILKSGGDDRAARIQSVFSLPYNPEWTKPTPK